MKRFSWVAVWSVATCVAGIEFGATAQAGVIGTATLIKDPANGIPFSAPDAALGAPWVSYRLSLTATGADTIQAVEATISGLLHQRWTDPDVGGVHLPNANSLNQTNGDSHFLATGIMLFASGPTEDNSGTGGPLSGGNNDASSWGVGTSMSAVFGTPGAALTSMNVAYIVVPKGSAPKHIQVNALDPSGNVIGSLDCFDFLSSACLGPDLGPPVVGDLGPLVGDMSLNPPHTATIVSGTLPSASLGPLTWAFDGAATGPGVPLNAPALDPTTGLFTWDVDGSKGGLYTFKIRATDNDVVPLSDTGLLTVQVIVPEPATVVICGATFVGLMCFPRRRSDV